ncbi:MAG TPA: alpha/beta hydrolase [Phycisphaerales bacterium]|nr:alpha/beta hydrolase [Phycisphaerales bacterium]
MRLFRNQRHAAEELAQHLLFLKGECPIVLGLANGGVMCAEVVAAALDAPLDVLLIDRLCAPQAPEHVVGAIDEDGRISMIPAMARWHRLTSQHMVQPAREAYAGLQKRRDAIRAILPAMDVRDRTVVIVSQGVASGAKMLGAIASVRNRGARRIVAAAPAGHSKGTWALHEMADQVVIPHQPSTFKGVRDFYEHFVEMDDEAVCSLLSGWVKSRPESGSMVNTLIVKLKSTLGLQLSCEIDLPPGMQRGSGPYPAVVFAHGFDSDARSERTVPISRRLAQRGIVGARLDFTGHGRSQGTREQATEVQMLHDLHVAFQAVADLAEVDGNRMGLNGAGTGAMIALYYATKQPLVKTLVIRGPVCGREIDAAKKITAPTLIIHGEHDTALEDPVAALDEYIAATHELLRISDASRMFDDPVSRELMVSASVDWLADHLNSLAIDRSGQSDKPLSAAT